MPASPRPHGGALRWMMDDASWAGTAMRRLGSSNQVLSHTPELSLLYST